MARQTWRTWGAAAAVTLALGACGSQGGSSGSDSASPAAKPAPAVANPVDACQDGKDLDKATYADIVKGLWSRMKSYHAEGKSTDATNGGTVTLDVDLNDPAKPKRKMEVTNNGTVTMAMITVDGATYMKMPGLGGGKWIKSTSTKSAGSDMSLDELTDTSAVTKVTCVGKEDVSGVKTAHYRVVTDMAKALGSLTGSATTASGTASLSTADLWLDDKGYLRKGSSEEFEMVVSKINEPVTITAPPASEVTEAPGMGSSS